MLQEDYLVIFDGVLVLQASSPCFLDSGFRCCAEMALEILTASFLLQALTLKPAGKHRCKEGRKALQNITECNEMPSFDDGSQIRQVATPTRRGLPIIVFSTFYFSVCRRFAGLPLYTTCRCL